MDVVIARPTFWNIPVWGEVGVYALGILAVAILAYGIWLNVAYWRKSSERQQAVSGEERLKRLADTLKAVLIQNRIRRTSFGWSHFALSWAFLLLFIGTALATIDWDVTRLLFDVRFLTGDTYLVYKFILEVAGIAALAALLLGACRRFGSNANDLPRSGRWMAGYLSLAFIIITGFILEALRLAATQPEWAPVSFLGNAIAKLFVSASPETLSLWHLIVWIVHGLAALVFVALIPLTIYAHLYRTPRQLYNADEEAIGRITPVKDIEEQEHFGLYEAGQITQRQKIALDACTECGRCLTVCPAVKAGTPLKPRDVITGLRDLVREAKDAAEPLSKAVKPEALWACTTCGACQEACPAAIEIPSLIVDMRRHLTLEQGEFPEGAAALLENIASVGNPWGLDPYERLDWANDLDVPVAEAGVHYEYLYWVGCAASYDRRARKIARAMVTLLKRAGVSFAVMAEERCHGEMARRLGEEYLFQTALMENAGNLAQYDFEHILVACPHCLHTFLEEYPELDPELKHDVVSHVDLIKSLIDSGRLEIRADAKEKLGSVVYHDPCYLARYAGKTEGARNVLSNVADLRLPEAEGRSTNCCGAGGGQMWIERHEKEKPMNVIRLHELRATKCDHVAVACPHCLGMLESARALEQNPKEVVVEDIAEIVVQALKD